MGMELLVVIGLGLISVISWSLIQLIRSNPSVSFIASFSYLLNQSVGVVSHRLSMMFIQVWLLVHLLLVIFGWDSPIFNPLLIGINCGGGIMAIIIIFCMKIFPKGLSYIAASIPNGSRAILQSTTCVTIIPFSLMMIGFCIWLSVGMVIGLVSLLAGMGGIVVLTFYCRTGGGAFLAASQSIDSNDSSDSLNNPIQILSITGHYISSMIGFTLDILTSMGCAIVAIVAIQHMSNATVSGQYNSMIHATTICVACTIIGVVSSWLFQIVRKKTDNILLEMGYLASLVVFILTIVVTQNTTIIACALIGIVTMIGLGFYMNYATGSNYYPIQSIGSNIQFGQSQVLISAFYNGLFSTSVGLLIIGISILFSHHLYGLEGCFISICYMMSVAIIAGYIKMNAIFASQISLLLRADSRPESPTLQKRLYALSNTLMGVGHSFSMFSGVVSSGAIIAAMWIRFEPFLSVHDLLFGGVFGVILICMFYALIISGTHGTQRWSQNEWLRQQSDIPYIHEIQKTHPNMTVIANNHTSNAFQALTYPGIWLIVAMVGVGTFISETATYGALLGICSVCLVNSFFWSLFGDSIASITETVRNGYFGGQKSSLFNGLKQCYYYAQYFQQLLAPTSVVVVKFCAMIVLIILGIHLR